MYLSKTDWISPDLGVSKPRDFIMILWWLYRSEIWQAAAEAPVIFHQFVFVSLLSHFWLIHFFHLRLLYQLYLGLCQAPCVQSHQRQPISTVAITACEVKVSAADSQTIPTVATWVWKPLCCRLTLTFTLTRENLSLYTTLLLLLVRLQLCNPRCWHLDSKYCRTRCTQSQLRFVLSPLLLHPHLLGTFQSDIPLFTLIWPAKHSPNQGWESTHKLHLYPLGGVFYSL